MRNYRQKTLFIDENRSSNISTTTPWQIMASWTGYHQDYFQLPVLCFVECCITASVLPVLDFDVQKLSMLLLWTVL